MHGLIGNGQDLNTLLGKMLRIDVNAGVIPYGIPAGNPNAANALCGAGGTGPLLRRDLRLGTAQSLAPVSTATGPCGLPTWDRTAGRDRSHQRARQSGLALPRGAHPYNASCGAGTGLTDPSQNTPTIRTRAITGGFVYRGSKHPAIAGEYVFGDYVSGRLFHISGATSGLYACGHEGRCQRHLALRLRGGPERRDFCRRLCGRRPVNSRSRPEERTVLRIAAWPRVSRRIPRSARCRCRPSRPRSAHRWPRRCAWR